MLSYIKKKVIGSPSTTPTPLTKEEKNFLDKFIVSLDPKKENFLDVTTENRKFLEPMCNEIEKSNQVLLYLQKKFTNNTSKKIHNQLCVKYNELVKQETLSSQQQHLDKENKKTEELNRHLQQSITANMGCDSLDYFMDHQVECKKQKEDADRNRQLGMLSNQSLGPSEDQIYNLMKQRNINNGMMNPNERSSYTDNPMFAKTIVPGPTFNQFNQLGARLLRRKKSRNPRKNTKKSRKSRKNAKKYRKNSRK
jgi:hypothetical protein